MDTGSIMAAPVMRSASALANPRITAMLGGLVSHLGGEERVYRNEERGSGYQRHAIGQ